jgi:hypothetical protein
VKPATVLFGRSLPSEFYEAQRRFAPVIDVLFVVGTSLNVSPANLLPTGLVLGVLEKQNRTKTDFFSSQKFVRTVSELFAIVKWWEKIWDWAKQDEMCSSRFVCFVFVVFLKQILYLKGDCDEVLLELAVELGWLHDLAKYKDEMCPASKQLVEKAQKHTK